MHVRGIVLGWMLVMATPSIAGATDAPKNSSSVPALSLAGRSVGSPNEGRLIGGARLADAPHLKIVSSSGTEARWGLAALVGLLERASRAVRRQFADAVLSVGNLSKQGGGEIDRHASHESGRDADVLFYAKNDRGHALPVDHFVAFRGDGLAAGWPGAHFDDAKNWAFVAAILNDPLVHVSHIFVANPMRGRLLAYAARLGVSEALRDRAALTMLQPRGVQSHDDHFHVRISCPPGMSGCIEFPTASRIARARHGKAPRVATPLSPPSTHVSPTPQPHTDHSSAAPPTHADGATMVEDTTVHSDASDDMPAAVTVDEADTVD